MFSRRPSPVRRSIVILLAIAATVGFVVQPRPAAAQFATISQTIVDIPRTLFQAIDNVRTKLAAQLKDITAVAFKSSIQIFEFRLLQEVQTQLATAGPGQKPLFLTNPKTFFQNVASSAATEYIDDFSRGVTGQIGPGTAVSGARARFLISRFLRAQAGGAVANQCSDSCHESYSVDNLDVSGLEQLSPADFNSTFGPDKVRNIHEWNLIKVTYDIVGPGGTKSQADQDPNGTMPVCADVTFEATGDVWTVQVGATDLTNAMTKNDCYQGQLKAVLNERAKARSQTNECLQECRAGVTGAALSAITAGTTTDVLSAIQSGDVSKVPAVLANSLSESKSDIGQLLGAAATLTAVVQNRVVGEQTNLNPNTLPKTSKVSEEVITPSSATSQLFGVPFTGGNGQLTFTGSGVADILKGITSFINSPVGRALANYFNTKCGLNPDLCRGPSNPQSSIGQLIFGSGAPTGVAGAQLLYAKLGQSQILTGDPGRNQIDVANQIASAGLIDAPFRQAIEETLTVQEAIDKHLLDPNKTFGFDKNGVEPRDGYPYRALQYLRKYRITPVGWELAAKYSQEFDHRDLSLGYLTKQFNLCGQDRASQVCSLSGTQCSTANDCPFLAGSTTQREECVTKLPPPAHNVCVSGDNVGRLCQQDSNCGQDANGAAIRCGASPYCGLVDPNWVLKAPQTYCRRQGAGEEIISKEFVCDQNNIDVTTGRIIPAGTTCSSADTAVCRDVNPPNCVKSDTNLNPDVGRWVIQRNTDTCADVQSCVAENDDGTCRAFGYCVQEKQQFKFDGAQCDAQNGSCTTYTDTLGQQTSYLASTLDFRNCSADNVGCLQYCAAGSYDPASQACAGSDRIDFTGKVQRCDQSAAGCRQYLRTTNGSNLFVNSGFETLDVAVDSDQSANTGQYGWPKIGGIGTYPITADDASLTANNQAALKLTGASGDGLSQVVHTGHSLYERSFTASFRAKAPSLGSGATCTVSLGLSGAAGSAAETPAVTAEWQTISATLFEPVTPADPSQVSTSFDVTATLTLGGCAGQDVVIDSAQFEENAGPTQYKDYGVINALHLNAKRQQCAAADVGCEKYTPQAGGSAVDGIVLASNRCSADKVGCAAYQLEPITTLPARAGATVNIVAPKGQQCAAADVGCEEYTNLDEVARGGEGKEYYKAVKQCVKPTNTQATPATYYTWVGDAQRGFVLRAYDLVKTNLTDAPHQGAPCTNLGVGTTTADPTCVDTTATADAASCSAAALATNPDCAQYYDASLNAYYRLRSRTVSITADCHPYRNTVDQQAGQDNVYYLATNENTSCNAAAAGCRAYTGNASGATRQLFADTFENTTTVNWTGGALSSASTTLGGHSLKIAIPSGQTSGFAAVNQSILQNQFFSGKTYLLSFTVAAAAAPQAGTPPPTVVAKLGTVTTVNNLLQFNPTLSFSGSAVGAWNTAITPDGPEWHQATVGPLIVNQTLDPNLQLALTVTGQDAYVDNVVLTEVTDQVYLISDTVPQCQASEVGCAAYNDRRGNPAYLTSFNRLCAEQVVGCEALIDTQNSSTSFSQTVKNVTTPADTVTTLVNNPSVYCAASDKGCEALGQPVYSTDRKLTSYATVYLKNDPDRYQGDLCVNEELFCKAYTTANGTAAFFKDPTNQTCDFRTDSSANGGQWFISGTNTVCPTVSPPLADRPVGASCSPACAGGSRQGNACTSDSDCPASTCVGNMLTAGRVNGPGGTAVIGQCASNDDCLSGNTCLYLAGTCPAEQNSCTEYRDPSDPANCRSECPLSMSSGGAPDYVDATCALTTCDGGSHNGQNCQSSADCQDADGSHACVGSDGQPSQGLPGCRSYYYLKSSLETNASSCNGTVNPAIGCRPFNDTTNPTLNFRGQ